MAVAHHQQLPQFVYMQVLSRTLRIRRTTAAPPPVTLTGTGCFFLRKKDWVGEGEGQGECGGEGKRE